MTSVRHSLQCSLHHALCCRNKDNCGYRTLDFHGLHVHETFKFLHNLVETCVNDQFSGRCPTHQLFAANCAASLHNVALKLSFDILVVHLVLVSQNYGVVTMPQGLFHCQLIVPRNCPSVFPFGHLKEGKGPQWLTS